MICKTLIEVLKLKVIPIGSKFKFRSQFKRLLERCNEALDREKILADTEHPIEPPKIV
jgi:hypothetical protein